MESIFGKGSRFHFTTVSRTAQISKEALLKRLAPWARPHILFIDTLYDRTGVVKLLKELKFHVTVIHNVQGIWNAPTKGDGMPAFVTVIVDSLAAVSVIMYMIRR